MARIKAVVVGALLAAAGAAQKTPEPGWTSEEAAVPGFLQAIARSGACEERQGLLWLVNQYRWQNVLAFSSFKGTIECTLGAYRYRLHHRHYPAGALDGAGEGWVLYAFPTVRGETAGRAFAVSDRGVVMFSDNATARYGDNGKEPSWTAVLAGGGAETFANVLTMPGKGMDGEMWQPLSMRRPATAVIRLRVPFLSPDKVQLVVGPRSWLRGGGVPLPTPVPAGIATPAPDGKVTLHGVGRADHQLAILVDGRPLAVPPQVILRDGLLEVTIDEQAAADARRNANESAAIATLKNISSAQAQFQACGVVDCDGDGAGEYGFFGEMSGATTLRSDAKGGVSEIKLGPPVLSTAFGRVKDSRVARSGYLFQVFLPDSKGGWQAEAATGGAAGVAVDPRIAEVRWCAYAWPTAHGVSGRRAFFVNEAGDVLATNNAEGRYSGAQQPIAPWAAFVDGHAAINGRGGDGERWIVVN